MEIKIQQQGDSQGKNSNKENNFNAACKKCFPVQVWFEVCFEGCY